MLILVSGCFFLLRKILRVFLWWFHSCFFIARANGVKVCFFEKDASQKAMQKEVEEEPLTSI